MYKCRYTHYSEIGGGLNMANISSVTRRDIFDLFEYGIDVSWDIFEDTIYYPYYGRFEVFEFLKRLYDLKTLESKDSRFDNAEEYSVKDEIKAEIFAAGDKVDATAISKGKGFQGAIKRLGQSRGPMAHGSKFHRHQGSNGSATTPGRVFKGKGMPGHMGSKRITIQNLEVVRVDVENNVILVKGAVPGPKKSLVTLKETVKASK